MSGRVRIKWEFKEDSAVLQPEIPADAENDEKKITEDLSAIQKIISGDDLTTVFQPVFNRENGSVLGYEALTRLRGENPFGEISELFLRALQTGCICALDCACLTAALNSARSFSLAERPELLFVNTCPETLMNNGLFFETWTYPNGPSRGRPPCATTTSASPAPANITAPYRFRFCSIRS